MQMAILHSEQRLKAVNFDVCKKSAPPKIINWLPLSYLKTNVRSIIPTNMSIKGENLVKIGAVSSEAIG